MTGERESIIERLKNSSQKTRPQDGCDDCSESGRGEFEFSKSSLARQRSRAKAARNKSKPHVGAPTRREFVAQSEILVFSRRQNFFFFYSLGHFGSFSLTANQCLVLCSPEVFFAHFGVKRNREPWCCVSISGRETLNSRNR